MKKSIPLLVIGGFLTATGIGISFYSSQLVTENLSTHQESLAVGHSLMALKELDPTKNENGVYVVQVADFKAGDNILAKVFDPSDIVIVSKSISHNPYQDNFKITTKGAYKLSVENSGQRDLQIEGVIGYLPKDSSLAISIFGFIVIIVGLSGLAVGMMYFVKTRKSNLS
ncbi:MAG: hypothetical protein HY295_00080 [Thaumarchaeota archaeon]|nr:hypothetical protein [Nitrososphaerota archaeon]